VAMALRRLEMKLEKNNKLRGEMENWSIC
jgi:hypothetical protein